MNDINLCKTVAASFCFDRPGTQANIPGSFLCSQQTEEVELKRNDTNAG